MNNLTLRLITGSLYVLATLASILFSQITSALLFLVVAILSQLEFLKTFKGRAIPNLSSSVVTGVIIYLMMSLHSMHLINDSLLSLAIIPVLVVFIQELYRNKENPFLNIGTTLMSIIYIVLPLALLNYLYQYGVEMEGPAYQLILAFFVLIWVNDSMAYVFGSLWGKNRLFKRISPKKSWEGLIGGIFSTLGAAAIFFYFFDTGTIWIWLGFAAIIAIFASLGDLIESMLKRDFEVKDSGSILPGHGGMLDRFDGVLLASPAIYLYIKLII